MAEQHPAQSGPDHLRALQQRHAAYYIGLASQAEQQYQAGGDGVLSALALFDRERDQLDAARAWLQAQPPDEALDELLMADADATVYLSELRYAPRSTRLPQLESALAAARRRGDQEAQALILGNLGNVYAALGETLRAAEIYKQHLAIARASGDRRSEGVALGNLATIVVDLNEPLRAIGLYEQHLAFTRETGDRRAEGYALGNLGNAYLALGEARTAVGFYQHYLAIARELGDRHREGYALSGLGNAYLALGEARSAIDCYRQHLLIAQEIGHRREEGQTMGNLGNACMALGETHAAIDYYQQDLAIVQEMGDRRGEGSALGNLGQGYLILGQTAQALGYAEQHLAIARETGDRRGEGSALGNLAHIYYSLGQTHKALDCFKQQLTIARETSDRRSEGDALNNLGLSLMALGEVEQAARFYSRALALKQTIEDRRGAAETRWNLGVLLAQQGDPSAARPHLEQGLAFFLSIDHPRAVEMAEWLSRLPPHPQKQSLTAAKWLKVPPAGTGPTPLKQPTWNQMQERKRQPDPDEIMQRFLPFLGDIALAAHGDRTARALAEAYMPLVEANGWRLEQAAQRIWSGERDARALTAGLDASSARFVQRVLTLVSDGPEQILSAGSLAIAHTYQQADQVFAQAQQAEPEQRSHLARQFVTYAQQAEQQPGQPWAELAAHLRALARQLTGDGQAA